MTPERLPAGDDRDLAHRVGARGEHPDDRVAGLVVGGAAAVVLGLIITLRAAPSTIRSSASVRSSARRPCVVAALGRQQRRLVDEVGEVGADHARASRRRSRRGRRRRRAAPSACGRAGSPRGRPGRAATPRRGGRSGPGAAAPGRGSRAGWSRRARSRPSRGSKPSISVRIWLSVCSRSSWPPEMFGPPAARERPTASSSSMKMIAGAACLGLLEQVTHARGADADDHLDELRRRHLEERHAGLAGDRPGQQRLAGARAGR